MESGLRKIFSLFFLLICLNECQWINMPGSMNQIDVGSKWRVYGINAGSVYKRQPYTSTGWNRYNGVSNGLFKHVSVGWDGTLWAVDVHNEPYRRSGPNINNYWVWIDGQKLQQVSVGSSTCIWGIGDDWNVYVRVFGSNINYWVRISSPTYMKYISVGRDCQPWGISYWDDIYQRTAFTRTTGIWTKIPGKLKQIEVGGPGSNVWGVSSANLIWKRQNNGWVYVPGYLKHVSVGFDGTVWGVGPTNLVFYLAGSAPAKAIGQNVITDSNSAKTVNDENIIDPMNDATDIKMDTTLKMSDIMTNKDNNIFGMNSIHIVIGLIFINILLLGIIFGGFYSKCKSASKTPTYHTLNDSTTESE